MPRTKLILAGAGLLAGVPLLALVILLNVDWNRARPWLNARASEALGRPFSVNGDLMLDWRRADNAEHGGWRALVPWPHLVARDVLIGNPARLAPPAEMASVRELSFSLDPLALLRHTIAIPVLRFDTPQVNLLRRADGSNNWTFGADSAPARWRLDLRRVVFSKGQLQVADAVRRADLTIELDTLNADPRYGVAWRLRGKYNGEPVSGSGKAGAVLSLRRQDTPYPLAFDLRVGSTTIAAEGTLTRPAELAALDMRLQVAGVSMARLYPLLGIVLPETPPFSTAGHLSASLGSGAGRWVYERFSGKVGASDIGGRLVFEAQAERARPRLTGTVSSRLLRLPDLAPLIGADSNRSKAARGAPAVQPAGKVLPVETFKTERWTSIDADVDFSGARIVRDGELSLSQLATRFHLQDGVLALVPLNFNLAGGTLAAGRGGRAARGQGGLKAIRAELKANARHLKLKQLFPRLQALRASVGEINGDIALTATGNSVATLLGASNGEIKTLIDQGTISKLLLEEMGLNIGNVVLAHLFGDRQVRLNCMATDFAVRNGLMQTRSFIVDTEDALLNVNGNINLASERLDLTLHPDSKGLRVFSLRAPLYVRGSFAQPDVSVDKGVLAMRAGSALALAGLAPLAALLPLINTGPGEGSACAALLAGARVKPVAPAPGQPMPARR